jgi:endonuclease/exonuclease/phosphatase family metal-dependent hydrolase
LIAGDLNEARAWDSDHRGHSCSAAFFDAVTAAKFTDITWRDWGLERPTRLNPSYQLDHVIAAPSVALQVDADDVELVNDDASDHAAILFTIKPRPV